MECKNKPKLMLTQQTFDTCIFQLRSWLPTEYLVDKWHCHEIFGPAGPNISDIFGPAGLFSYPD